MRRLVRFLAFADLQGNPHAAQAILLAAKKLDDVELVCLGNAMGPGPDPKATLERLRKAHVHLVRGSWDAAALNLASAPLDQRLAAKPLAAALGPAELAYLREATPPRRLVAGGKRILLTSETAPDAGAADVVLRAGPRALVAQAGARLDVAVGNASADEHGESPYVLYDADTNVAKVQRAAWDRSVLRKNRYGETTNHA